MEFNRDVFNEEYSKHTAYTKHVIDAANKITKPYTEELEKCIERVLQASRGNGTLDLDYAELEKLAVRIPSLCLYIQFRLNEYELRSNLESLLVDGQVVDALEELRGQKGDAREKMKRAEASQFKSRVVELLDAQVCANLKSIILRADKVYEGIKKILDARMRENEFNRKSQKYNT